MDPLAQNTAILVSSLAFHKANGSYPPAVSDAVPKINAQFCYKFLNAARDSGQQISVSGQFVMSLGLSRLIIPSESEEMHSHFRI